MPLHESRVIDVKCFTPWKVAKLPEDSVGAPPIGRSQCNTMETFMLETTMLRSA